MRNWMNVLAILLSCHLCYADELATPDNTQSVLKNTPSSVTAAESPDIAVSNNSGPSKIIYKNKKDMPPCAVQTAAGVCMTQTGYDACCQKVTSTAQAFVAICAPACPTKQDIRSSRNGARVVYDYGRYEAVVTDKKDGTVEVRYRKRLLDR